MLFSSGIIAGEALTGIGIIFIIAASNDTIFAPQAASPLLFGLLLAGTVLLVGGKWSAATRWGAAAVLFLVGGAVTALIVAAGAAAYQPFSAPEFWPGLLVFAYVAVLMAYLPLRALLIGKEPEDMPAMAVEH